MALRIAQRAAVFCAVTLLLAPFRVAADNLKGGQVVMEFVGQVLNFMTTPATSHQFGYLTYLRGVDQLFTGTTRNEQTALFTFYNETTNRSVVSIGPLRVITRDGRMTVFAKTGSADFANPDSFRAGTPVLVATLRHTVVVNTTNNGFFANFENVILDAQPLGGRGDDSRIGRPGEMFRISINGQLETPGPPSGWIAGTAFGVEDSSRAR